MFCALLKTKFELIALNCDFPCSLVLKSFMTLIHTYICYVFVSAKSPGKIIAGLDKQTDNN